MSIAEPPHAATLRITEIFLSLQGESTSQGLATVFVRLTGCPLRCRYCDTAYAFSGGQSMTTQAILKQVAEYGVSLVTVTGGEPLAQAPCGILLRALCDVGFAVSLETSGALDIAHLDPRVIKILDVKTPGSGEMDKNLYGNFAHLSSRDEIKFVICNADDYQWSKRMLHTHDLAARAQVLFSPATGDLDPAKLAQWILDDRLTVRFQIQLHKVLWGEVPGR